MRAAPRYSYKGVSLPLTGWAKRLGARPEALQARLDAGWTFRKTILTPLDAKERVKPRMVAPGGNRTFYVFEADGVRMTAKEWAKALGRSRGFVYECFKRGKPVELDDGWIVNFKRQRGYEYYGETRCASDWAERLRISPERFLQRIRERLVREKVFEVYHPGRPKTLPDDPESAKAVTAARRTERETRRGVAEGVDLVLGAVGAMFG